MKREELEKLIFGEGSIRRFTQDSPILPDVWISFGENPSERVDLLLNPFRNGHPGKLALALKERLREERKTAQWQAAHPGEAPSLRSAQIAYNQATVVARLSFNELMRVVLPMTSWWDKNVRRDDKGARLEKIVADKAAAVKDLESLKETPEDGGGLENHPLLLWMARVVGRIGFEHERAAKGKRGKADDKACVNTFAAWMKDRVPLAPHHRSAVWTVTRNRDADPTMWRSTLAVKADAARGLFSIRCADLTWAVLDSGIDATHPAFAVRDAKGELPEGWKQWDYKKAEGDWSDRTRVKATYDFASIRKYLTMIDDDDEGGAAGETVSTAPVNEPETGEATEPAEAATEPAAEPTPAPFVLKDEEKTALREAIKDGRALDWDVLGPVLKIEHDQTYVPPIHEHGTHVAGILAGDWRAHESKGMIDDEEDLVGVCPDLQLFDLRVLNSVTGTGDEFSVMAALQFIRHLNSHRDYTSVHGVNMSLSIRHDVSNYACGCTPVCEECGRVVNAGTVVVAAAGNLGYLNYMTAEGKPSEGYRSISLTDPGNSEDVITVGSTHAYRPHTYGVSYFSSRGPTGDGRIKPDLVAPGEKITSLVPGRKTDVKDGTSMAAPHVSGAAALLMARHKELIGRPRRVKEILCSTATDLGRERYFQGGGMVDILRALQSV